MNKIKKVFNPKCEICNSVKVLMHCIIYATPDNQPYNNQDYQKTKTDCFEIQVDDSYSVLYCEKCEKFDTLQKDV